MHEPAFWDDAAAAQSVSSQYSRLKNRLDDYHELATQIDDLEVFLELANEEAVAGESPVEAMQDFERVAHSVQRTLDRFEEQRLFSGEFDAAMPWSAFIGCGGTGARIELKCCAHVSALGPGRGCGGDQEATGDEAGLKSAPAVHARTHTGSCRRNRVCIVWFASPIRLCAATSFASLDVSPLVEDDVAVDIDERSAELRPTFIGAGGQHVNKTDSAVRITHLPTKTVVPCQNERSQIQNRETAMRMLRSKLLQLEYERRQQGMAREKGEQKEIAWGSQIRSYVLAPYTLVKDHRTNLERGNVEGVLNGAIDDFIREYLVQRATGKLGQKGGLRAGVIRLEDVTTIYPPDTIGLESVSLHIEKGEFVFLVGPSGSGKSTFIRLIIKELEPDRGRIFVGGRELGTLRRWKVPYLRRNIGCVFQDFKLLPNKTVTENVMYALFDGNNSSSAKRKVGEILSLVGLGHRRTTTPTNSPVRAATRLFGAGVREPSAC